MGIDLCFKKESLIKCSYAHCRELRSEGEANWYSLGYDAVKELCSKCPIKPVGLGEDTCYVRFSSYPYMNLFRSGFVGALLFAMEREDKEKEPTVEELERTRFKDVFEKLFGLVSDTEIDLKGERFFNLAIGQLNKMGLELIEGGEEFKSLEGRGRLELIDKVITKLIYREKPYMMEEIDWFLPILQSIEEFAEEVVFRTNEVKLLRPVLFFRERIRCLIAMMETAKKFGLELSVSF